MNPKDKALLALIEKLLPDLSPDMVEECVTSMEKRVTTFVAKFKEAGKDESPTQQMKYASNCAAGYADEKTEFVLKAMLQAFYAQALWACAFNKTMPEAMEVYGNMMREQAK